MFFCHIAKCNYAIRNMAHKSSANCRKAVCYVAKRACVELWHGVLGASWPLSSCLQGGIVMRALSAVF
jgi:hypothetical protein